MVDAQSHTTALLQQRIVLGLVFDRHAFGEWSVWRHSDQQGNTWDVAQHGRIREAGRPIWQVFQHNPQGHLRTLTSAVKRLDGTCDEGALYRANVFSLEAMLMATVHLVQTQATCLISSESQLA